MGCIVCKYKNMKAKDKQTQMKVIGFGLMSFGMLLALLLFSNLNMINMEIVALAGLVISFVSMWGVEK